MFTVYHSNQLSVLKDIFLHVRDQLPRTQVFAQDTILVQSKGMEQWLKQQIAAHHGISALLRWELPAQCIWNSYHALFPDLEVGNPFSKSALTWTLMRLLPQQAEDAHFKPLARYIHPHESSDTLYPVACHIADLFDQYLIYRPDWLLNWEQGGQQGAEDYPWQPILWRAIIADSQQAGHARQHRADLNAAAILQLQKATPGTLLLPKHLFIFGISALAPQYLSFFQALQKHSNIHYFLHNPCQVFWSDLRDKRYVSQQTHSDTFAVGNPLLSSFGKLGRDYLSLLEALSDDHQAHVGTIDGFVDITKPAHMLSCVQQDILHAVDRSQNPEKTPITDADRSIVLHSCHNAMREVEVLHDQLLALFEQDTSLTPKDIVVMIPQIEHYRSAITTVFGATDKKTAIPFSLSDIPFQQAYPIIEVFLDLLRLPTLRGTATEILELLETPAIFRRFDLTSEAIDRISLWVDAANIRWGFDGTSKSAWDLPEQPMHSWQFGLERLLAGYAMGESDALFDDIAPLGTMLPEDAENIGKLSRFIDTLQQWQHRLSQPGDAQTWFNRINHLLEDCLAPDDNEQESLHSVREQIQRLFEEMSYSRFTTDIDIHVIYDWFSQHLQQQHTQHRFLTGGVNFCTLLPMRSVPFKVLCLLGMNQDAYPSVTMPKEFDVISHNTARCGDRSRREDDRYLFLEALLSAEDTLYISYIGRSEQDNSPRNPSVLVTELCTYLNESFVQKESDPVVSVPRVYEHKLQAFDRLYFSGDAHFFSYANLWYQAWQQPTHTAHHDALTHRDITDVALNTLIRYWRNPARFFCNNILQINWERTDVNLADDEPFTLDALEEYRIKARSLKHELQDNASSLEQRLRAEGVITPDAFGTLKVQDIHQQMDDFWHRIVAPHVQGEPQHQEISLIIDNLSLQGWVNDCYALGLVRYRPVKKNRGQDLQALWLEHLCLCSMGRTPTSTLISLEQTHQMNPVAPSTARDLLSTWLTQYIQGYQAPIFYLPNSGWAWVSSDTEKAEKNLHGQLIGGFHQSAEADCPYVTRLWPQILPEQLDDLKQRAEQLLGPLQDHLVAVDNKSSALQPASNINE